MSLNPLDALGNFVLGFIKQGKMQAWMRLIASVLVTSFVTFTGTMGASIWTLYEQGIPVGGVFLLSFANGLIAVAASVLFLWARSPLTKGIPIALPTSIEKKQTEMLAEEGMTYLDPRSKGP